MLVTADEIQYDYTNDRVSAVSRVQIHYAGSTLEADKVIYDQKAKRLHAEGNVRLTDADGKILYANMLDLSDDFRDGFVELAAPRFARQDPHRGGRARERTGNNITVFQNGVYTACEPCAEDPPRPPLWQVKAARIIHDQTEKTIYYEDARIEILRRAARLHAVLLGARSDGQAQDRLPDAGRDVHSIYGFGASTPFYWALAPNYDVTITPTLTSHAGAAAAGRNGGTA